MKYWNNDEKDALRSLIDQHLTGEEISRRLSVLFGRTVTRSAATGQAGRLGLKVGHTKQSKPKPKPKPNPQVPVVAVNHAAGEPKIKMRPCTIFELKANRCRYPLWPDHLRARPEYLFCGARVHGPVYCQEHERVVYNRSKRLPSVSLSTMIAPAKPAKSTIW